MCGGVSSFSLGCFGMAKDFIEDLSGFRRALKLMSLNCASTLFLDEPWLLGLSVQDA